MGSHPTTTVDCTDGEDDAQCDGVVRTVSRPRDHDESHSTDDTADLSAVYKDVVLEAPDVCNNCFSTTLVERSERRPPHERVSIELSQYERDPQNTVVDHAPAPTNRESAAVFCECGVEGAFDRIWNDGDGVDEDRLRDLVQNLIRTLESKGFEVGRKSFAGQALLARATGSSVDVAMSDAVAAQVAKVDQSAAKARCDVGETASGSEQ